MNITKVKHGPNCGYDWLEIGLNKFLRDIDSEKIILGLPLYSRTWRIGYGEDNPNVVAMKSINSVIPEGVVTQWDDAVKQRVAEYTKNGYNYKMWLDDEEALGLRIDLALEKKLGGVAFWVKDRETETFWNMVKQKLFE